MNTEEEKSLKETSRSMKATVQVIQEQMKQQDLLYECIEVETTKNKKFFSSNMDKFEKVLRRMNGDPRNKIILMLILVILGCGFYLSP